MRASRYTYTAQPGRSQPNSSASASNGHTSLNLQIPAPRRRTASDASSSSSTSLISPAPSSATSASSSRDSETLNEAEDTADGDETAVPSGRESMSTDESTDLSSDLVLAMHDYEPDNLSATYLPFRAGQVIRVLNRDSTGWWDGELDGRRGWFPSNYVSVDVNSITQETSPFKPPLWRRPGHAYSKSTVSVRSVASWASAPAEREHAPDQALPDVIEAEEPQDPAEERYCPPAMVPLLHTLSLLQGAVRANRVAHFQPATACIIAAVRNFLSSAGCLPRDAPVLRQLPQLAKVRKTILSDLAALVAQSKKASAVDAGQGGVVHAEVEAMLKNAGQVFTNVRRFITMAEEYRVPLSADPSQEGATGMEQSYTHDPRRMQVDANRASSKPLTRDKRDRKAPHKAKSASDLRHRSLTADAKSPAQSTSQKLNTVKRATWSRATASRHRSGDPSISSPSSVSSARSSRSSFVTADTAYTPPPLPSGPSTGVEVVDTLKRTHNQYLSTIAAFVGQSHSHSRSSHASSTAHMYELARAIVEMVCKMLTIVDAVAHHPGLTKYQVDNLRGAKDGLYRVTRSFAESVRLLTAAAPPDMTEEEERAALQRSATDALKAGGECVQVIKMVVSRADKPLVIHLERLNEVYMVPLDPTEPSDRDSLATTTTAVTTEEVTARTGTPPPPKELTPERLSTPPPSGNAATVEASGEEKQEAHVRPSALSTPMPPRIIRSTTDEKVRLHGEATIPEEDEMEEEGDVTAGPDVRIEDVGEKELPPPPESRPQTPLSIATLARTDDGTLWEGSVRNLELSSTETLEEKLLNGDLPPLPQVSVPEYLQGDPTTWMFSHDYGMDEVAYNQDGNLVGATLPALVEKMSPHDAPVDPAFASVFFLTFRLFSNPHDLVDAIVARFHLRPGAPLSDSDMAVWQQRKGAHVRLRVATLIRTWLDFYWRPEVDSEVLPSLLAFTHDSLTTISPGPGQRILDLIAMRQEEAAKVAKRPSTPESGEKLRDGRNGFETQPTTPQGDVPRPVMTKTLLSALRAKTWVSIAVSDFDPLELARQFTIMECNLFCAIAPEEALDIGREGAPLPPSIKAVTTLSTLVTGWVSEIILNELDTKKRTSLVKFFIKLADRCASLNNFATTRSILAALDSSTISRLSQTWLGIALKHKTVLEGLRKLADHSRNYNEYRTRLRNTTPPAVPFLGLYLTDLTFCREGNPSHRMSPLTPGKKLINFNKYQKLVRITQDMQRFQVHYNLKVINEVQDYLRASFEQSRTKNDLQDLYRRSLLVEPKRAADTPPGDSRQLFSWVSRDKTSEVKSPA